MWKWLVGVVFVAVVIVIILVKVPPSSGGFKPNRISLIEQGDLKELLDAKLTFVDSAGLRWVAPQGTLTDGATVPRLVLPITDGRWDASFLKAAVVHDAYCQEENKSRTPEQYQSRPWPTVHRMFFEAMIAGGTDPSLAKLMYAAVWLAGPRWNDAQRDLGDLPAGMLMRGFSGTKTWIERYDPSISEIEAHFNSREPVLVELYQLESGVLSALKGNDSATAQRLLDRQDIVIRRELGKSPSDPMLQIFDGYMHKNKADLLRRDNLNDRVHEELIKSERIFVKIIEDEPENPSALVGLGTVSVLQGDLSRGEQYVRRALSISPAFETARQDLRQIEELRVQEPAGPEESN